MTFNKGDVVQLKSGGPKMTVVDTGDYRPMKAENGVQCMWFEKTKSFTEVFPEEALEKPGSRMSTVMAV